MPPDLPRLFLDAITAHFLEFGPLSEKTADDLRYELEYHNDWRFEEYPEFATEEEVTLLQLLEASTAKLASGDENPDHLHIHRLIEEAFLEEELHTAIQTLWPQTHSTDVTLAHLALMETAISGHLSPQGAQVFQSFAERVCERSENSTASPLTR